MNKVWILEQFDHNAEASAQSTILNVFANRASAEAWRDRYIREEFDIADDFDGDLEAEVPDLEFSIHAYYVLD
jgi:hypothetical protein